MLAGEPLITRVIQRVQEHGLADELVVATDSPMVAQVVERSQVRAVITDRDHLTGTDRVAEVAARPEFAGYDAVLNVQGDEPFLAREALAGRDRPGGAGRRRRHRRGAARPRAGGRSRPGQSGDRR